ncbi:MAG TPA: hypothetical protein VMM56_14475 [Planctomycetaceae bacterium]|nr:hypothetical protein [Planctomycetaceae bacterium]
MIKSHTVSRWSLALILAVSCLTPRHATGQVSEAQINEAKTKGIAYLKSHLPSSNADSSPMIAYTLVKTGSPKNDPFVVAVVKYVKSRVNSSGEYDPGAHHLYTAGTTAMLLDAMGGENYEREMKAISNYIIGQQLSSGAWYYPSLTLPQGGTGDTSITQYALLGLWAAHRAGVDVPKTAWDRAGRWLLATQLPNGSFIYHPGENHGGNTPRPSLAVAGGSSLMLCMRELFPEELDKTLADQYAAEKAEAEKNAAIPPPNFGGLVELVDVTRAENTPAAETASPVVAIQSTPESLRRGVNRAIGWVDNNFDASKFKWPYYYLYGLERLAAFTELEKIGQHDWYLEGAEYLIRTQSKEGFWKADSQPDVGTCFGVLFLQRATSATLGPIRNSPTLGTGLLAGGRGLPKDLTQVQQKDGRIQSIKVEAPIADLLSQLEATGGVEVLPVQEAVIEMVRSDQREELIGQTDRLKKLIQSPDAQVRMIALWALSRSDDITLAPIFIDRLRSDKEFDVALEANRSLCVLSRRLEGVGLPEDPLEEQRGTASQEQLKEIAEQWRADATERWHKWYLSVRPYNERDDLLDLSKLK